jgi:hypothetical protein
MVPADKILENQYTGGNEFVSLTTGKYYQGYYCIISGNKYYEGKTYNSQSKQLKKVDPTPVPATPVSLPPQTTPTRYFLKKINIFPVVIKEVDEQTYNSLINNVYYQRAIVESEMIFRNSPELDKAERQMSGLKAFLSV